MQQAVDNTESAAAGIPLAEDNQAVDTLLVVDKPPAGVGTAAEAG